MQRLFSGHWVVLLITICVVCAAGIPAATATEKAENPAASPGTGPSTVVARIGPYTITRQEIEKQWLADLQSYDFEYYYDEDAPPADAMSTLMKMLGEKAMVLDARAQGMLENEQTQRTVRKFSQRKLAGLLAQTYLTDKVSASEDEIAAKMKTDPKLDKARAKAMVERDNARRIWDRYYLDIYRKLHAKRLSENFPIVIQAHDRLLYRPKTPRKQTWILNSQIEEELTPQEKQTVLATFDKGKITVEDWLRFVCDSIAPPGRPRTANESVVDKYLAAVLQLPLLVAEAESLGLNKNAEYLKQVREYEDMLLLGSAKNAKTKDPNEPTSEQIKAYFDENKETFGRSRSVKIDQIWCEDLAAAGKVRAELDAGGDFEQVKQKYSLEKKLQAYATQPGSETVFWKDLWAADPNTVVGPVKGFYQQGVKWRVVKVLEKKPAEGPKEYDDQMMQQVKGRMMAVQREAVLAAYRKELLEKYTHQIYADKVKDIDVFDID